MDVALTALEHEKETNLTKDTISECYCLVFKLYAHTHAHIYVELLCYNVILHPLSPANFPPNISADIFFKVTLGQESIYNIAVNDPGDEVILTVLGGLPANSILEDKGSGEYVFHWNLQEVTTKPLVFVANDSKGASSTFIPIVEVCACANGGNCTREGLLSNNATTVLNCMCSEGKLITTNIIKLIFCVRVHYKLHR